MARPQRDRFRFAQFELDLASGILSKRGHRLKIQRQPFQVLTLLIRFAPDVVSRDAIRRHLWGDELRNDFDQSINFCIRQIRAALSDTAVEPQFLETVPREGYRFIGCLEGSVTVEPSQLAEVDSSKTGVLSADNNQTNFHTHPWRTAWFIGGALAVAAVLGLAFWRADRSGVDSQPDVSLVRFTSTAGFAEAPAFSPDGNQIAYSWNPEGQTNSSIYAKLIGTGAALQLTYPPGSDSVPAWSPDGRYIAFYRNVPNQSGYYLVSALGGTVRRLLRADFLNNSLGESPGAIAWFPDGRHVAVVMPSTRSEPQLLADVRSSRRILRLDIETGEQVSLTNFSTGKLSDAQLAISPDGKMLAFVQAPGTSADEIFLLPLAGGGRPRRLTDFGAYYKGVAWSADSRELIFAMEVGERERLWRLPVNGGAAHPITSSLETLASPAVADRGNRLA